jgi:hypothetical protein
LQLGTGLDVFCAYEGCELVLEPRSTLKPFVTADPFQHRQRVGDYESLRSRVYRQHTRDRSSRADLIKFGDAE